MANKKPNIELCGWTKEELHTHFDDLKKIVAKPKFACTRCGRAANAKKWLCKAKKL